MTVMDVSGNMVENGTIGIPWKPEEERRVIEKLMEEAEANHKEGDLYYVISARWFSNWQNYTGEAISHSCMDDISMETCPSMISNAVERPGPIDNTDIVVMDDDDPQVILSLQEECDYKLLHYKVWQELYGWYKGGPALPRKMISVGDNNLLAVEVFPLCLNLIDSRDKTETIIRLSKKASLHELYERVGALKSLDLEKVCLWDYFENSPVMLISSEKTLEESLLEMNNNILVEVKVNGIWPSKNNMDSTGNELALVPVEPTELSLSTAGGPTLSSTCSRGDSSEKFGGSLLSCMFGDSDDSSENLKAVSGVKGLSGLVNLGNTCFMNSALQCLLHTHQLVDYFLKDFIAEINKDNLLGMNGELAIAFGNLLRKLWCHGCRPLAPRGFKLKLGRFAPQFSGYNQHDSQELLAFLLDGLHEDLNRVKQKPYIEAKDFDDRPDREIAEESWRYHKARNDSIIVDTYQGQYKSTLVCPVCDKISVTFDPFMYLSLPLPSRSTREITVTVFYGDGSRLPIPYTVTVLKQGCCTDLQKALGDACGLGKDEYLLIADVYSHKVFQYYENPTEPLSSIKDADYIVAYILPKRASDLTRLEICHRYLQPSPFAYNSWESERKLFLTPLITFLENPQSGADIDHAVSKVLSPFRRKPLCTSTMINLAEEPRSFSKAANTPDKECTTSAGQDILSIDGLESEAIESPDMSFQICFTSDHGLNSTPIEKDTPVRPGRVLKVVMDWFEEDDELYDGSCLMDIPKVYNNYFVKKAKEESISLFSCLDVFMKEEPLGPDDMWYCPHCKEHRQATKKLDLWRLPNIVVFHLKRFSYGRWSKDKLEDLVEFPVHNLDLSKYVKCMDASEKSHIYDLYAISNHYGGLGGGHYTACCKCEDDRWYHFDDSLVSSVEESEVQSSAAYVLFYKRVDVDIDKRVEVDVGVDVDVDIDIDIDMDVDVKHPNGDVGESSQSGQHGW